jgi:hypothetical protein
MAKVGCGWGLLAVVGEAVGPLFRGGAWEWREEAVALSWWIAGFAVGGVLYSLFLPPAVCERPRPAAGVRMLTGACAGALTGGLVALAKVWIAPTAPSGDPGVEAWGIGLALFCAVIGAVCGFAASLQVRYGARTGGGSGMDGAGASPRLVGPS